MRPNLPSKFDPVNSLLSRLDLSNFKYRKLSDTTASVAHTEKLVKHGLSKPPQLVIPFQGNIYVHKVGPSNVDIRSAQTSVPFSIIIIG